MCATSTAACSRYVDGRTHRNLPATLLLPYGLDADLGADGHCAAEWVGLPLASWPLQTINIPIYSKPAAICQQPQSTISSLVQVSTKPGEVIKPDSWKVVDGEGMPIESSPYEKGNLYIQFDVKFPDSLSQQQVQALQQVPIVDLPPVSLHKTLAADIGQ